MDSGLFVVQGILAGVAGPGHFVWLSRVIFLRVGSNPGEPFVVIKRCIEIILMTPIRRHIIHSHYGM
jgi:hypothetical protein